ncbi:type IV secretory system conjugative DNA transfer family protein [Salinarchaeum chitinilyticum]
MSDVFEKLPWVGGADDSSDDHPVTDCSEVQSRTDGDPGDTCTDVPGATPSYDITERSVQHVGDTAVLAETAEEGPVAGQYVRTMFEDASDSDDAPLWVGYTDDPYRGFREAPLRFDAQFRHCWVAGTTGYGKTTTLLNMMVQWAYGGHGFCYVDPKGEDSRRLLRMLPEDRLEDVVWIEPGGEGTDRTVGINFLELPAYESPARRENEIESRVETLTAVFDTEEYWGINMSSITESMGRAMLQSDTDFSVIDMYFVLANADRRASFADEVEDPYVREFCREIARMDDETVRPLLKRMKAWVENAVVRRIIAHRESTIDFGDVVENDRIVVVRTPVENPDIKQMIALGVLRNLWSAIQRRAHRTVGTPDPYFVLCDEFDEIASKNLDVAGMLARARSMRLGVTIATQYPSQLEDETLQAVQNNCDNLLAFSVNKFEDARILMDRFEGYDPTDLTSADMYRAWTKLPLDDGRYSRPVLLDTFPPYPPLRPEAAVDDVVEASLQRYGTTKPTDEAIVDDLVYGSDIDIGDTRSPVAEAMASAVRSVQFRNEVRADNGWVPVEAVDPVCAQRLDAFHPGIEYSREEFPETRKRSELIDAQIEPGGDGVVVRLTGSGESATDTEFGAVKSAGGPTHKALLLDAERALSRHGFLVEITEQDNRELPDGLAVHPETDLEYAIEAETTTPRRPVKVLQNLKRAQKKDRVPIFLVRESDPTDKWAKRMETILAAPHQEPAEDGGVRLYNRGSVLSFGGGADVRGGVTAVRPRTSDTNRTVWTKADGELVLSDGSEEITRLSATGEISKDALPATYSYDGGEDRYTVYGRGETSVYPSTEAFEAEWVPIKRPFRPRRALPDPEIPEDSYLLLLFTAEGELRCYRDGESYPPNEYPYPEEPWPVEPDTAEVHEEKEEAESTDQTTTSDDSGTNDSATDDGGSENAEAPEGDSAEAKETGPEITFEQGSYEDGGVAAFVDEFVREAPDEQVRKDDLFERYQVWADDNDVDATNDVWFGRRLLDAVDCESTRVRGEESQIVHVYDGIELCAESDSREDDNPDTDGDHT